ncbi:MAG: peptide deformylase [Planctomycetes bacterium RBG_13_60_9]|nr:MAG: peptide deformylase [Planctomycetes bacterium RBG_13_60_9]
MSEIDVDKCRITYYPTQVLRGRAAPVEKVDENIRRLVDKMKDVLVERKGIGLAAPQIGVPLRLFIVSLSGTRDDARAYVNPTVTPHGDLDEAEEGCLSVPGVWAKIRRYKKATVTATDLEGNQFTEEAEGLYARCLQHEYDHIEGTVIVNRMGTAARIAHRRQLKKLADEQEGK